MEKTVVAAFALWAFGLGVSSPWSQETPIVSEELWRVLAGEFSPETALDHVRHLTLYHSPNAGSEGFQRSAEWIAEKAKEFGLENVGMLSLNKPIRGWTIRGGEAWIVSPFELKLGDVRQTPLRVATNSHSADVTAELVDVGEGTKDSDYEGRPVKDNVVLASGDPAHVHDLAVWKYGAAGVICAGSRRSAFPDQLPWQGISEASGDHERPSTFAWILTPREGERLRRQIREAQSEDPRAVQVRVTINAEFGESTKGILEAWIHGSEPSQPGVILVAHLQEEKTSANDNRSGCASLLEIGRTLVKLTGDAKLARPRRDIRFWWVDEISAPYQYFAENPEASRDVLAAFNQDMVAAKLSLGPRYVVMSRTPFSRPSFLNDVAESVLETVVNGNTPFPFSRGDTNEGDFSRPLVSPLGTREPYRAMALPFYNGSDHIVFNDGRIGIPAVSLNNWPDPYIHSSDDDLWQIDATQLGRNAFVVAATAYFIASAGEPEMGPLTALMLAGAQKRLARDSAAALLRLEDGSAGNRASRYEDAAMLLEVAVWRELAAIDSALVLGERGGAGGALLGKARERVEILGRSLREDLDEFYRQRTGRDPKVELPAEEQAAAKRVPRWSVSLAESMDKLRRAPRVGGLHPFYAYEVLNLIDGRRSVLDIYRTVRAAALSAGEWYYGRVELVKVIEVLEAAENAGAVSFESR